MSALVSAQQNGDHFQQHQSPPADKGKEKLRDGDDERDASALMDEEKENRKPTRVQQTIGDACWQASPAVSNRNSFEATHKEDHDERSLAIIKTSCPMSPSRPPVDVSSHRREMLSFVCPLTRGIFQDPVFCADGHTYERHAIKLYLKRHHRSPATGQRLEHKKLTPNYHLRKLLATKRDYDPVFSNINFFAVLPNELVCLIFGNLDPASLGRAMMVCRMFAEVLRDDVFWRHMLERDAPGETRHLRPRERYFDLFRHNRAKRKQKSTTSLQPLTLFRT